MLSANRTRPAHRVDVAESVGRGDCAVLVGRIHDRREEIDRLDQCLLVVQPVYGGVVGRAKADQELGMLLGRKKVVE